MQHWNQLTRHHPWAALRRLGLLTGLTTIAIAAAATPALADDRPDGAELATAAGMMVVIVIMFIIGILGIMWSKANGEFDEPEEVKYHMLAMADDEPDYWGIDDQEEEEDLYPSGIPAEHRLLHPVGS